MFLFFYNKRGACLISNEPRPRTFHLWRGPFRACAGSYEALRVAGSHRGGPLAFGRPYDSAPLRERCEGFSMSFWDRDVLPPTGHQDHQEFVVFGQVQVYPVIVVPYSLAGCAGLRVCMFGSVKHIASKIQLLFACGSHFAVASCLSTGSSSNERHVCVPRCSLSPCCMVVATSHSEFFSTRSICLVHVSLSVL